MNLVLWVPPQSSLFLILIYIVIINPMTLFNFLKKDSVNESKPQAFIFLGRSGCGKGTQVDSLRKYLEESTGLKTLYMETGSYFRNLSKNGSYTAELTKEIINTGGLMPSSMAITNWMGHLIENYTGHENIIFDGVSRRINEAKELHDALKFYKLHGYKVLYINVSKEWATEKLLGRAKKEGRPDDQISGIEKRQAWFEKDIIPVIEYYRNLGDGCEFIEINGEQLIPDVYKELMAKVFNVTN